MVKKNKDFIIEDCIKTCRRILKKKLTLQDSSFRGYVKERTHILDLLKRTIEMGESNSVLIIGPRGSGKTTLLNSALNELRKGKLFYRKALVVELHGLMHCDDRLALKDVTKQLQLQNVVGSRVFGSFAENLTFLLESLKSGSKDKSKSIIFILDEFDLFCSHHNQTLLYNLFDVAQSAQLGADEMIRDLVVACRGKTVLCYNCTCRGALLLAADKSSIVMPGIISSAPNNIWQHCTGLQKRAPICVVGLTCRLDVTELLEKRVKSRFSHRQIYLFPSNDLKARMLLVEQLLSLPEDQNDLDDVLVHCWNSQIAALCSEDDVKDVIKKILEMDNSERTLKYFLFMLVSKLSDKHDTLTAGDFVRQYKIWTKDAKLSMIESLSVLEMCLVIAMKHQTEIYDGEPLNFEMIYRRFLKFTSQNSTVQNLDRPVVLKAFEHLQSLELVVPVSGPSSHLFKEYQLHKFMLTSEQVNDGVKLYQGLPTEVEQWAASSYQ